MVERVPPPEHGAEVWWRSPHRRYDIIKNEAAIIAGLVDKIKVYVGTYIPGSRRITAALDDLARHLVQIRDLATAITGIVEGQPARSRMTTRGTAKLGAECDRSGIDDMAPQNSNTPHFLDEQQYQNAQMRLAQMREKLMNLNKSQLIANPQLADILNERVDEWLEQLDGAQAKNAKPADHGLADLIGLGRDASASFGRPRRPACQALRRAGRRAGTPSGARRPVLHLSSMKCWVCSG